MSFAGDPTARRISEPQIAPTLNIDLPGPWFFTFYPSNDIRINFGQPKSGQTGRLFLPFDALIGSRNLPTGCKSRWRAACRSLENIRCTTSRQNCEFG
jgi:hypothetical protein